MRIAGGLTGSVKAWIEGVEVLGFQLFLNGTEGFAETLIMDDLSGPQEPDGVSYLRDVADYPQDVIVSGAGFLLWGDLVKITYKNTRKNR